MSTAMLYNRSTLYGVALVGVNASDGGVSGIASPLPLLKVKPPVGDSPLSGAFLTCSHDAHIHCWLDLVLCTMCSPTNPTCVSVHSPVWTFCTQALRTWNLPGSRMPPLISIQADLTVIDPSSAFVFPPIGSSSEAGKFTDGSRFLIRLNAFSLNAGR